MNETMEETAPLNGTIIKDQAWKEKKGVGPLIMVAVLLLGLAAFYAGQMSGSNAVATRGGGGADGSVMSYNAFESMESTTNSCYNCSRDHLCCCKTSQNQIGKYCYNCLRCIF